MNTHLIKVSLIASALLLSACSGVSSDRSRSTDFQSYEGGFGPGPSQKAQAMNFHGSALGSSFSQYSSGLLHDD
jgi:uncharacterized lipoprotein